MVINNVEAEILRVAMEKLIPQLEEELKERQEAGNNSPEGQKELNNAKSLKNQIDVFCKQNKVMANPLSTFPKSTGN